MKCECWLHTSHCTLSKHVIRLCMALVSVSLLELARERNHVNELRPFSIRKTCVRLSWFDSPMYEKWACTTSSGFCYQDCPDFVGRNQFIRTDRGFLSKRPASRCCANRPVCVPIQFYIRCTKTISVARSFLVPLLCVCQLFYAPSRILLIGWIFLWESG